MKKLAVLALIPLLAACGSEDKKPGAGAPPAPAKADLTPVKGQEAGVVCPTLEGAYENRKGDSSFEAIFKTVVADGKFSYAWAPEMEPQAADGQPERIETEKGNGAVTVTCDKESVTIVAQEDGKEANTIKYTPVDETTIRVEATGEYADMSGTFTKKQQ